MAVSQIDGGRQIKDATVTNTQIATAANIALSKLATPVIQANGGQAFTADQSHGGFKITSLADGTIATDGATYGQLLSMVNGFDVKASVRCATSGAENYTISAGAVTQITGTTVDGQSPAVGERILVKNAPSATGAGTADSNATGSNQPANGIYRVTNATTNLTITRDADADASAEVTGGMSVWVNTGTVYADQQWTLISNDPITLNTTALQFTQTDRSALTFSGGLTKTGNNVTRDALTNDVTTTGNAATIANNAVSFAKMQDISTDVLLGRDTAATGDPEQITVGGGLEFTGSAGIQRSALTGDISATAGSNTTAIGANKVTLGMLATLAANSIIGNATGSTATPTAVTADTTLTIAGGTISRAALTGDVTAAINSNATVIANSAVSLAKMANLAANSVIGNATGSATTPTAVAMTAAPTASTVAFRDTNANIRDNNLARNLQSILSAGATTTLTVSSPYVTVITGATTQTVVLPDATTLPQTGFPFKICNRSSGVVTVNANGGGLVQTMAASSQTEVTVTNIGSAAGAWDSDYSITNAGAGGGTVTTVSVVTANGFQGTVGTATTTPAITLQTSLGAGLIKSNGSNALVLATAGTDYLTSANIVTRETPSGAVNGSNVTYTLAFTPISGTEHVYLNGLLQEPGAGNDYTISGNTITYLTAPVGGATPDKIRVSYFK